MNMVRMLEVYFNTVRSTRESRTVLKNNQDILARIAELEAEKRVRKDIYVWKVIVKEYGERGTMVLKARSAIRDNKYLFLSYRPTIRLIQCIRYGRLSSDEKAILIDFLANPRDMNVPPRLIGLATINPKLMSEVLCKKLYGQI